MLLTTLTGEGCQCLIGRACRHHSAPLELDLTALALFGAWTGLSSAGLSGHGPQGQAWDPGLSRDSCQETSIRLPQHSHGEGLSYSPQKGELRTLALVLAS